MITLQKLVQVGVLSLPKVLFAYFVGVELLEMCIRLLVGSEFFRSGGFINLVSCDLRGVLSMRKLSRSFFWIDQELIRSGVWLKMSSAARLSYVALVASVNKDGTSLWGETKLLTLAGVNESEWVLSLGELVGFRLVEVPAAGEVGIKVLGLGSDENSIGFGKNQTPVEGVKVQRPLLLRTITTVELEGFHAECKDSK